MADVVEQLQQLGFSEYEARAYVALLQQSPQNGYELAKNSGLPRANVYSVLEKLEERGAVVRLEETNSVRYAPVSPGELIQRLENKLRGSLKEAHTSLNEVAQATAYEAIFSVRGYLPMLDHARSLIDAAKTSVLVAQEPPESQALKGSVEAAMLRGVKIVTLCLEGCLEECGNCRGSLFRYHVEPLEDSRWLVLLTDEQEMLAAEIGPGDQTLAVRTRQRLLASLAGGYIRRSIALAAVVNDLDVRLEELLNPLTKATLAALSREDRQGGFLQQLRVLLRETGKKGGIDSKKDPG